MGSVRANLKMWQRSAFAFCFLASSVVFGETRGPLYIKENLPFFYRSVSEAIGEERSAEILKGWGRPEVELISDKLANLISEINFDQKEITNRTLVLKRFHKIIIGTLGEAYGLRLFREKYADQPIVKVIDEITYAQENNQIFEVNNRPDALAYSIRGGRVRIHDILESKVGGWIKNKQLKGWLARWKTNGITLEGRHFSADQVDVFFEGKPLPLSAWDSSKMAAKVTWVTNQTVSNTKFQVHRLPITQEEMKKISAGVVAHGLSSESRRLLIVKHSTNRYRQAIIRIIEEKLDSGRFKLPTQRAVELPTKRLARAIQKQFEGGNRGLYEALPPRYQKMMREAGFDPSNPRGSAMRMHGLTRWSEEDILERIKQELDAGIFRMPSGRSTDREERKFSRAIWVYFGSLEGLYEALPNNYQRKLVKLGFDSTNARISSQRMRGTARWSKELVLETVKQDLDSGTFKIPARSSLDLNEQRLARAISNYWGLTGLYNALPVGHKKKMRELGFDPADPVGSAMRRTRLPKWTKQDILEKIIQELDLGTFKLPFTRSSNLEERSFARAIQENFKGGLLGLYEALPTRHQKKLMETGFDPENPVGSAMRRRGIAKWSKSMVLENVMQQLDSENFKLPARNSDLGAAIRSHFNGRISVMYQALPLRYQKKMRVAGFDPSNPKGSSRRMNGNARWSREVILERVEKELDAGTFKLSSQRATDPNERSYAQAIAKYFNLRGLYEALEAGYRKKLEDFGFDPTNSRASSRRMNGTASWSKKIILEKIEHGLKSGKFTLPDSRSENPSERSFAYAIQTHFYGLKGLYEALRPGNKVKLRELGFDPNNPAGSARHMHKQVRESSNEGCKGKLRRLNSK